MGVLMLARAAARAASGACVAQAGLHWHRTASVRDTRKTAALAECGWQVARIRDPRLPHVPGAVELAVPDRDIPTTVTAAAQALQLAFPGLLRDVAPARLRERELATTATAADGEERATRRRRTNGPGPDEPPPLDRP